MIGTTMESSTITHRITRAVRLSSIAVDTTEAGGISAVHIADLLGIAIVGLVGIVAATGDTKLRAAETV